VGQESGPSEEWVEGTLRTLEGLLAHHSGSNDTTSANVEFEAAHTNHGSEENAFWTLSLADTVRNNSSRIIDDNDDSDFEDIPEQVVEQLSVMEGTERRVSSAEDLPSSQRVKLDGDDFAALEERGEDDAAESNEQVAISGNDNLSALHENDGDNKNLWVGLAAIGVAVGGVALAMNNNNNRDQRDDRRRRDDDSNSVPQ